MESMNKVQKNLLIIVTTAIGVSAFIPTLVLLLLGGKEIEIAIVLSSLLLAWLIIAPLILFRSNTIQKSYCIWAPSIIVYLFFLELITSPRTWFFPLGLTEYLVGITALGLIIAIWTIVRFRLFYGLFLTILILGITTFLANYFLVAVRGSDGIEEIRNFVGTIISLTSLPFLVVGIFYHKTKIV